jgi:parvulin-like peptidyl-prolyl isomerase
MKSYYRITLVWFALSLPGAPATAAAASAEDLVVATVGDRRIFQSWIDREYQRKFAERDIGEELAARLRSRILDRLVRQTLVLEKFAGSDLLASEDEIELEISRLRERLQSTGRTLEDFLQQNHQSLRGLRFELQWQISWQRYLDRTLTDEVLEGYFRQHRARFDGTRVRVAHLLLAVNGKDAASQAAARQQATQLRQQMLDGSLAWEEAVARHSTAPSGQQGGDLGWIGYEGPMSRSFTEAAFALETGGISEPVETSFGIHLVRCLDIRPGQSPWYDVRDRLKRSATEELFQRIADKQATLTEVRILADPSPATADRQGNRH